MFPSWMTSSIYMLLEFEWPRTKHTSRCFDTCVCAGSLQSIHGKHITIDICFRKLSHFLLGCADELIDIINGHVAFAKPRSG